MPHCVVCAAPCHRRAEEVEGYDEAAEELIETDAEGDGWVSTGQASHQSTANTSIPDLDSHANQAGVSADAVDADDDIPDIDDLAIEDEDDEVALRCCNSLLLSRKRSKHRLTEQVTTSSKHILHRKLTCLRAKTMPFLTVTPKTILRVAHSMLQSQVQHLGWGVTFVTALPFRLMAILIITRAKQQCMQCRQLFHVMGI